MNVIFFGKKRHRFFTNCSVNSPDPTCFKQNSKILSLSAHAMKFVLQKWPETSLFFIGTFEKDMNIIGAGHDPAWTQHSFVQGEIQQTNPPPPFAHCIEAVVREWVDLWGLFVVLFLDLTDFLLLCCRLDRHAVVLHLAVLCAGVGGAHPGAQVPRLPLGRHHRHCDTRHQLHGVLLRR